VKFLNTLERLLKNIQSDDMNMIEKTIPSLMNGIKLIFVISRHFKSDERIVGLLVTISNEICDKIESKFSMKKIFYCPEGVDEIQFLDQNLIEIN
jgi:dynein heavy chain